MGSPHFAVPSLLALHEAGHEIAAVYCQPAKPAGRGQREAKSSVQVAAEALGLNLRTPRRLRGDEAEAEHFAALRLDAAVVAAYGLILPPAFLAAPERGCLNIHASLLPRWRGAAPIQAAILAGDAETGITIMQMDAGLDTGAMLLSEAVPITASDTASTLHDRLQSLGARLILRALAENPAPRPQGEGGTYAPKLSRADARIDWHNPAPVIERKIRAFTPWPGTETTLDGSALKILAAIRVEGEGPPGQVLDDRLTVACGQGALRLTRVQKAGRAALDAGEFLRGTKIPPGASLGA
jgi:methionyl-tRNA formyltransferase